MGMHLTETLPFNKLNVSHVSSHSLFPSYSYLFYCSDGFFFAVKEVSLLDQGSQGKQSLLQLEQVERISLISFFAIFYSQFYFFIFCLGKIEVDIT
jgi:hypothetical protein